MTCDRIREQMGSLFRCEPHDDATKITTPFVFPDGDVIDLFLIQQADYQVLTDYGESWRWVASQTTSSRKTLRQKRIIEDACLVHGVQMVDGMLAVKVSESDNLAALAIRLSQACLGVASASSMFRSSKGLAVMDDVEDLLASVPDALVSKSVSVSGNSGRQYTLDFVCSLPSKDLAIHVLTTGSRAAARPMVERVVAMWVDLLDPRSWSTNPHGPKRKVSLVDDTSDVWATEDLRLLQTVCDDLVYTSKEDDVRGLLLAKAS